MKHRLSVVEIGSDGVYVSHPVNFHHLLIHEADIWSQG